MNAQESAELLLIRENLAFQLSENERYVAELSVAVQALAFQREEGIKHEIELDLANIEVALRNAEKEKRAAELQIANIELAFQNEEKSKRSAELLIANQELVFQNQEKEKRAAELIIANAELVFQNSEKEKRAAELVIANRELLFQNTEKEKRAAELIIANRELLFQSTEKGNRAAELVIANQELSFQHAEKEKRAHELIGINAELEAFTYVSSHDLQEPLRKIFTFSSRILDTEDQNLTERGKDYFTRIRSSANQMQKLIDDLLAFSILKNTDPEKFKKTNLSEIIRNVMLELNENIIEKSATIEISITCEIRAIQFQFRQVMMNLIMNALKFSSPERTPVIHIQSKAVKGHDSGIEYLSSEIEYCHLSVSDNGIGFDSQHSIRIFDVFQRLHGKSKYEGSGIGLAIVKRIIDTHKGFIYASSEVNKGTTFNIYLPIG